MPDHITARTVTTAKGLTRTDLIADGEVVGFVGHLPDLRGFVAVKGREERIGAFTDYGDAERAVRVRCGLVA